MPGTTDLPVDASRMVARYRERAAMLRGMADGTQARVQPNELRRMAEEYLMMAAILERTFMRADLPRGSPDFTSATISASREKGADA